jgi:hypothetical protein
MLGTAPMPVWRVAPSLTKASAEGEGLAVHLDEHVDQFEGQGVVVVGQGLGTRQAGIGLEDQEPLGILPGAQEFVAGRAQVQRQVDPAVLGRRALDHHHPRRHARQDRRELPEAARDELDGVALGGQQSLGGSEEPAAVANARSRQHVVEAEQECATQDEVLPVVARAQGGQELVRVGGAQAEPDGVDAPDHGGRFGRRAALRRRQRSARGAVGGWRQAMASTYGPWLGFARWDK